MPMTGYDEGFTRAGLSHPSPIDQIAALRKHIDTREEQIRSLNAELHEKKLAESNLRREMSDIRRQHGDLLASNNRYLERARLAEMALDVTKDTVASQNARIESQAALQKSIEDQLEKATRKCRGLLDCLRACESSAAKALGYPRFMDDQDTFPGAAEEDGYCIGEHVADTIVDELAEAYRGLRTGDVDISNTARVESLRSWVRICHGASVAAGWYTDLETGERKQRNVPEMLCLIHSEISEAMEGVRKNLQDDKLPHRRMVEVELADAFIRIADLAGYLEADLGGAVVEKMAFNALRPDHKIENRIAAGGKSF